LKNSFSVLKIAIDERKIKNLEGELESKKAIEGTFSTTTQFISYHPRSHSHQVFVAGAI
jgi:hypothetical protein